MYRNFLIILKHVINTSANRGTQLYLQRFLIIIILTKEIYMVLSNILIKQENLNLLELLYVVQIHLSKTYNLTGLILLDEDNFLLGRIHLKKELIMSIFMYI